MKLQDVLKLEQIVNERDSGDQLSVAFMRDKSILFLINSEGMGPQAVILSQDEVKQIAEFLFKVIDGYRPPNLKFEEGDFDEFRLMSTNFGEPYDEGIRMDVYRENDLSTAIDLPSNQVRELCELLKG